LIGDLEAIAREAWPAREQIVYDGWILGSSGAYTRRANSVAPVAAGSLGLEARLAEAEAFYARRGRPAVFKLHAAAQPPELDAFLAARGYAHMSPTIVMTRTSETVSEVEAATGTRGRDEGTQMTVTQGCVETDWFDASVELSSVEPDRRDDYRAILDRVLATTSASLFGRVERDGKILSLALGCVVSDAVSFVQVATDREARGCRLAEQVLRGILRAAHEQGAPLGLLSVEADNEAARRLYGRLGFVERYRYWYREQPATRG
jgi:ribosomal protein S18 acetylase RimI-like enzyme